MFEEIKTVFLNYVDMSADEIKEDSDIIRDLQMNSFDIITMVGEVSDKYGIEFDQSDLEKIATVGDFANAVAEKIEKK